MRTIKINLYDVSGNEPVLVASRALLPADEPALRMVSLERERAFIRQWVHSELPAADATGLGNLVLEIGGDSLLDCHLDFFSALTHPRSRMFLMRFAAASIDRTALYNEYDAAGLVLHGALPLNHVVVSAELFFSSRFSETPVFAAFALELALNLLRAGLKANVLPAPAGLEISSFEIEESAFFVRKLCGYVPAEILKQTGFMCPDDAQELKRRLHCSLNLDEKSRHELAYKPLEVQALRNAGLAVARPFERLSASSAINGNAVDHNAPDTTLFDEPWKFQQISRTRRALDSLQKLRRTDTCVIVGNGPSLNHADLSILDEADVFISNYAVYSPLLLSKANYLTVTNALLAAQEPAVFNMIAGIAKIAPLHLASSFHEGAGWLFADAIGAAEFCATDPAGRISWSSTVTFFNLQLAYYLGYTHVKLIGVDNAYSQPDAARFGQIVLQETDDQNHFDPLYFRGRQWQAADTDEMTQVYQLAAEAFRQDGRVIENLSASAHAPQFSAAPMATKPPPNHIAQATQSPIDVVQPVAVPAVYPVTMDPRYLPPIGSATHPASYPVLDERVFVAKSPSSAQAPTAIHPQGQTSAPVSSVPESQSVHPPVAPPTSLRAVEKSANTGSAAPAVSGLKVPAQASATPARVSSDSTIRGQSEICEEMLDDSYGHLNFALYDVAAGQKRWHYFGFKLQTIDKRSYLELRFQDIKPFAFIRAPRGVKKDQWGEYLRILFSDKKNRTARALDAFLMDLNDVDQQAFLKLLPDMAQTASRLIAARVGASPEWAVMAQDFEHVVELSVRRLMQQAPAAN